MNNTVEALTVYNGKLIVGGEFTAAGDKVSRYLARWTKPCCDNAGDANNDGAVNVGDATLIINYVFSGGPPPPCMQEGDANGGGAVEVGDAVYIVNYIFKGGPAPVCGPA